MNNNNDFFKFEDKNIDFPLYKEKFEENRNTLLTLIVPLILFTFIAFGFIDLPDVQRQTLLFLITLIPLLLLTKCNLGTFFRKPSMNDLRLVIVSYILYEVYYLMICAFLSLIHFKTTPGNVSGGLTLLLFITNVLQIIGEEIFKIFIFLLCMNVLYKHFKNRKISIVISTIIIMIVFALMHVNTYNFNVFQVLLFQGGGSLFTLFSYLKTKNLTLPLLIHLLIDVSYWIMLITYV